VKQEVCSSCGASVSLFDVHCRSCGLKVVVSSIEEQIAELGITYEIQVAADQPKTSGMDIARFVIRAVIVVLALAFAVVLIPADFILRMWGYDAEGIRLQNIIERAFRNS
jgi:hypothetical protein